MYVSRGYVQLGNVLAPDAPRPAGFVVRKTWQIRGGIGLSGFWGLACQLNFRGPTLGLVVGPFFCTMGRMKNTH